MSGFDLPYDGRPHAAGNTVLMTSAKIAGIDDATYTARRASIDQLVARELAGETPLRSIEIGIDDGEAHERGTAFHWWSHNGPNSPNRCVFSCRDVFNRLFGDLAGADPDAAAQAVRERRSVLDAVMTDARQLARGLGSSDRPRLEQHLEAIRSVEKRIMQRGAVVCKAPGRPGEDLVGPTLGRRLRAARPPGQQDHGRAAGPGPVLRPHPGLHLPAGQARLAVAIGSIGYGRYHDITHNEPGDQPKCTATIKLFMRELLVLVQALQAVPEGNGTLLDNCGILAASDCTTPKTHGHKDFPMLVLGKAGGRIRTGLHVRGSGENACRVLLSLARATGAKVPEFGEADGRLTERPGRHRGLTRQASLRTTSRAPLPGRPPGRRARTGPRPSVPRLVERGHPDADRDRQPARPQRAQLASTRSAKAWPARSRCAGAAPRTRRRRSGAARSVSRRPCARLATAPQHRAARGVPVAIVDDLQPVHVEDSRCGSGVP